MNRILALLVAVTLGAALPGVAVANEAELPDPASVSAEERRALAQELSDKAARQLEDRDVRLYCTACVCGAADEEAVAALPSSGQTAAAREHTEATSHALLEQDGGVGWGERVQLRTGEISQERVVCGVYMQVEGERNDRKVASVSIGLRRCARPPLILGARDDMRRWLPHCMRRWRPLRHAAVLCRSCGSHQLFSPKLFCVGVLWFSSIG